MAMAGAGMVAVAALLMGAFLARSSSVGERQAAADREESRTAQLQSQVAALAGVETLQAEVAARRQTISGLLANDVAWTTLLEEVSTVLPNDVWLTAFNGTAGDPTLPGSVNFSAMGFDQTSAARWLLRIGELDVTGRAVAPGLHQVGGRRPGRHHLLVHRRPHCGCSFGPLGALPRGGRPVSRRIMLGAGAALVVLVLAWYMLLWGPQGGRADDADARRDVAAGTNMQLEANVARLQAGQAALPGLQADLETLRTAVPDTPNLAQFILDANDAATASGVDFLAIAPTPPAENPDPSLPPEIDLNISVNGGYFQVMDYLNRLNDLPRLVVVDTVALTPGETVTGTQSLAAGLTARMFTTTVPVTAAEAAATARGRRRRPSAVPTANTGPAITVPVTSVPAGEGP